MTEQQQQSWSQHQLKQKNHDLIANLADVAAAAAAAAEAALALVCLALLCISLILSFMFSTDRHSNPLAHFSKICLQTSRVFAALDQENTRSDRISECTTVDREGSGQIPNAEYHCNAAMTWERDSSVGDKRSQGRTGFTGGLVPPFGKFIPQKAPPAATTSISTIISG